MSYKEDLYKNALTLIGKTYEKSKYDKDIDLYRIYDIINSLNDNQTQSKQWLAECLIPYIKNNRLKKDVKRIAIVGSWYGLLGIILREHLGHQVEIINIDADPLSKDIGVALTPEEKYTNNFFVVSDAADYLVDKAHTFDVIINTSCEHMEPEDVQFIIELKNKNALICFQSNNYKAIDSHINTSDTLEEFVDQLNLVDVLFSDSKKFVGVQEYNRYTVIGL